MASSPPRSKTVTYVKKPTGEPPCREACPAGIDIPRYIRLIAAGRYDEALAVIRDRTPFPSVCGYVCFHPCEAKCRQGDTMGSPVAINALKRFAAEKAVRASLPATAPATGKKAAVIGSGPAGLTAAYYLALLGHAVTVFERLPEAGGMMRYGIPAYRLPRNILDGEIDYLRRMGIQIKTSANIDAPVKLLSSGFDAVFIGSGAHKPLPLGIKYDGAGLLDCVSFLRDVSMGKKPKLGAKVGVVGGGNAAVDSARTALRLGAKQVSIIYRRSLAEMPASHEEVEAALKEGVEFVFLTAPKALARRNGALSLQCLKMRLGKADASGRRKPEPVRGSEYEIQLDSLISAIGQAPELPAESGLAIGDNNMLRISKHMMTSRKGIFAGGDAVSGPASVIEAIAAGRNAAMGIDRYLGGSGRLPEPPEPEPSEIIEAPYAMYTAARPEVETLPVPERLKGFAGVEKTLDADAAIREARRCLGCGLPMKVIPEECRNCLMCELVCSLSHEGVMDASKAYINVSRYIKRTGELELGISFDAKCDSCGLCSRYCVYGALLAGGVGVAHKIGVPPAK